MRGRLGGGRMGMGRQEFGDAILARNHYFLESVVLWTQACSLSHYHTFC